MSLYETSGQSDDWYTPHYIFDELSVCFDLDVAAPIEGPRYVPCDGWIWDDSLTKDWHGFVWMNPPFGHQASKRKWLKKFFDHGNGIALMPDRTSAPWFQEFVPRADVICWVAPKIKFERPDGTIGESPGVGTVLLGSGIKGTNAILGCGLGMITVPIRTR